jgi:hypothetical protein
MYLMDIRNILNTNRLYTKPLSHLLCRRVLREGSIDPSTSVSTGNLVSYLVSCGGFRSDASSLVTMLSVMR